MPARRPIQAMMLASLLLVTTACGDDDPTRPEDPVCTGAPALAIGNFVLGTLVAGDDTDVDGAFLDRYSLAVAETSTLQITMTSTELDSFLWLLDDSGSVVEGDDDSGGDLNARIVETLDRGCYVVEATTFVGETGSYAVRVQWR